MHVKERLTGALILVALLVILVPEILPGPVAERTASEIGPSKATDGPPLRSYSMELGGAGRVVEADQSALAPQPATATAVTTPPPATPGKPETAEAVAPPTAGPVDAASADDSLPATGWWVQLGVFSQSANAQRLVQSLTRAGFRTQMTPMRANGKDMYRVRSGPVADRAAAEVLRARLSEAGHKGTLVAP